MYHSITFGDKNTWDDWKIVPSSRPVFSPPKQKTNYIDIPGSNGALDLSEALTGYPIFNNREGSFEFIVLNDYKRWNIRYSEIMEYLHGNTMQAILEDEPEYFYQGRFTVSAWNSSSGDTWSRIMIDYNVEPYKWSILKSTDEWLWDPFNFETGVIQTTTFKDIVIDSDDWVEKSFVKVLFGGAPSSPEFVVASTDEKGMDVEFMNRTVHLNDGINSVPEFILYGQTMYAIKFNGHGTVSIDFRSGRL